jgi:heme/copper-type cytochrome/quinol oxidase subunit 4
MGLNWPAVLVAGIADWLLGAVWFTVFSKQWQAGLRMSPEQLQTQMAHPNFWPYIIAFLCSVLLAYVIARLVASSPTHGLFRGITIGLLVGLGAAVAMVTEMVFEVRAQSFILISAAYPFLGCILMGIIVGAWRRKPVQTERPTTA